MIDPQKALHTLHTYGPQFAQAKGARVLLEETLKIVRAKQSAASSATSAAAREVEALASDEYAQAVQDYATAVEVEEELRRKLITAEAAIELWRSYEASNRRMDRAAA